MIYRPEGGAEWTCSSRREGRAVDACPVHPRHRRLQGDLHHSVRASRSDDRAHPRGPPAGVLFSRCQTASCAWRSTRPWRRGGDERPPPTRGESLGHHPVRVILKIALGVGAVEPQIQLLHAGFVDIAIAADELVERAGDGADHLAGVGDEGPLDRLGLERGLAHAAPRPRLDGVLHRRPRAFWPSATASTSGTRSVAWLKAWPSVGDPGGLGRLGLQRLVVLQTQWPWVRSNAAITWAGRAGPGPGRMRPGGEGGEGAGRLGAQARRPSDRTPMAITWKAGEKAVDMQLVTRTAGSPRDGRGVRKACRSSSAAPADRVSATCSQRLSGSARRPRWPAGQGRRSPLAEWIVRRAP